MTERTTGRIPSFLTTSRAISNGWSDLDGDGNGDPTNETASGGSGPDIRFKYDRRGNLRFEQDANLRQGVDDLVFYQYDGINRQTAVGVAKADATIPSAVGTADEATTEFTYDVLGNLEETEDPTDKITQDVVCKSIRSG